MSSFRVYKTYALPGAGLHASKPWVLSVGVNISGWLLQIFINFDTKLDNCNGGKNDFASDGG